MTIHSTAIIDPRAIIDPSALIGPHVVIQGPVQVGPLCRVAASAVILGNTRIGAGCQIHSHAVIGDVPQDHSFEGSDSYCLIGDECTIREGATIHRGTAPGSATIVGDRCFLLTNSHVAHNCEIGNDVILLSGALLAGYVRIGARAIISGNAAVHQFVRIGELAMISGLGKVSQDVPPFFMTDREGAVVGENRVGLMRAGLTALERKEIKAAFRVIYRSGMGHQAMLDYLSGYVSTDAGQRLLDFLAVTSKRGLSRDTSRLRRAA
ncbi:MAG TPA: acyl-ACP--UDP-N-acetylglucosamine O-acyltransferase [Planctomycetaceae bacterium]|nr:acyl-ACP--UDP-N-acetylglucosamine O-acyltransferase [Planctomycetaceae bacterium]